MAFLIISNLWTEVLILRESVAGEAGWKRAGPQGIQIALSTVLPDGACLCPATRSSPDIHFCVPRSGFSASLALTVRHSL